MSKAKRKSRVARLEELRNEYNAAVSKAERLREYLCEQLSALISQHDISLGVPLESRVKTLTSVSEKILGRRKGEIVGDLDYLIGVRCILLFQSDLSRAQVILKEFNVISFEDTATRLNESQFGYQSNHYIVTIADSWIKIPSYSDLGGIKAELQLRTLAQHIWAAASHKLQYKHEQSVPPPLRRSINRASALLETVDLEFERILDARRSYAPEETLEAGEMLNVDNLARILQAVWPQENHAYNEDYDGLLRDLQEIDISTPGQLREFLTKWAKSALQTERETVRTITIDDYEPEDIDRFESGVFFTHCGLTRMAMTAAGLRS